MVMFNWLGNVNYPHSVIEVEQIVLREISVDEPASLVKSTNDKECLLIRTNPIFDMCITKSRCSNFVGSHEIHHYYVIFEIVWVWNLDQFAVLVDSLEVPDFLLGPHSDHFTWVFLVATVSESELSLDIALSVLEWLNWCLEDLDCIVLDRLIKVFVILHWFSRLEVPTSMTMVDICFLTSGDATSEFSNFLIGEQFVHDNHCALVQAIINCGSVRLVFLPDSVLVKLVLHFVHLIVHSDRQLHCLLCSLLCKVFLFAAKCRV